MEDANRASLLSGDNLLAKGSACGVEALLEHFDLILVFKTYSWGIIKRVPHLRRRGQSL
jgi:hypothetical protein